MKAKVTCISKIVFITLVFAVLTSYSGQWEVFTNKNDVRDVALSGNTLWAATTGGVVAWNLDDNSYTSYTTADGLISCNINQVAIDKNGRTWVAAKEPCGLFVYENHTWKQMNVGGADNDIVNKVISGLEVDQFGNVWVYIKGEHRQYFSGSGLISGTYLWRYDGLTWHRHEGVTGPLALDPQKNLLAVDSLFSTTNNWVHTYHIKIVSFNGSEFVIKWRSKVNKNLNEIGLAHIAQDSKGNPWISFYDDRFGDTYGVVCNDTLYNTLDGLADDNVRNITADESGAVWCATDGGISKFTGVGWVTYDTTKGVASNQVYKILTGSNNTLYAATSKGISILKSNQWKTLGTINEPSHNNYMEMVIDKSDAAILSGGDHIAIHNDLQWEMIRFLSIRVGGFIKSNGGAIYAMGNEIEKGGCILKLGTGGSTVLRAFSYTLGKFNRFSFPAVASSGNDPYIWLTDDYSNLILLNKQTAAIYPPSRFGVGGNPRITCMLLDRDGRSVWVGYKANFLRSPGIVHFDGDSVKKRINVNDSHTTDWVTSIVCDSAGNLWFASGSGNGGITVLRDTKLTKYLMDSNGKMFGYCNALFVDKSEILWAYTEKGIARYDGSSWKLFDGAAVSPDLPYACHSHIIQDKSGTIWFGTEGSGLLAYKDNRWYQFTTRDGLPHNSIRNCALDSKNNLWILTDNGIARHKSGGMVHNLTRGDFVDPGYKKIIKQRGSRFYVSSKEKPEMLRYTLYDLRGRVVLRKTIHRRRSFSIPQNNFRLGSGLRILSITKYLENTDGSQNKYLLKMGDIK